MTQYDESLTDDEWRELNFPTDVLHASARMGHVASASALIKYADKNGPEGLLESAIILGQADYRKVEKALRGVKSERVPRRRKAHRV